MQSVRRDDGPARNAGAQAIWREALRRLKSRQEKLTARLHADPFAICLGRLAYFARRQIDDDDRVILSGIVLRLIRHLFGRNERREFPAVARVRRRPRRRSQR